MAQQGENHRHHWGSPLTSQISTHIRQEKTSCKARPCYGKVGTESPTTANCPHPFLLSYQAGQGEQANL